MVLRKTIKNYFKNAKDFQIKRGWKGLIFASLITIYFGLVISNALFPPKSYPFLYSMFYIILSQTIMYKILKEFK